MLTGLPSQQYNDQSSIYLEDLDIHLLYVITILTYLNFSPFRP